MVNKRKEDARAAKGIGIFGGSFDPPHNAHFFCARIAAEYLGLHKVLVVPAYRQPLKPTGPIASPESRWRMILAAVKGDPLFQPVRWELERGGISWSIETVERAAREYPPPRFQLYLIVGADAFKEWHLWKEGNRILELAHLAVLRRGEEPLIPDEKLSGRITLVPNPVWEISSTLLRERIRQGLPVRWAIPQPVERIIRSESLYLPPHYDYP